MTVKIDGELEVDLERGVIYFHSNKTGTTLLRICGLEFPEGFNIGSKNSLKALDVTLKMVEPHPVLYFKGD